MGVRFLRGCQTPNCLDGVLPRGPPGPSLRRLPLRGGAGAHAQTASGSGSGGGASALAQEMGRQRGAHHDPAEPLKYPPVARHRDPACRHLGVVRQHPRPQRLEAGRPVQGGEEGDNQPPLGEVGQIREGGGARVEGEGNGCGRPVGVGRGAGCWVGRLLRARRVRDVTRWSVRRLLGEDLTRVVRRLEGLVVYPSPSRLMLLSLNLTLLHLRDTLNHRLLLRLEPLLPMMDPGARALVMPSPVRTCGRALIECSTIVKVGRARVRGVALPRERPIPRRLRRRGSRSRGVNCSTAVGRGGSAGGSAIEARVALRRGVLVGDSSARPRPWSASAGSARRRE
mmetsp:Transcript_6097/g.17835  ORF Transcript_6097/g.17835 Transcript_6097/m.17835 type:complete len:340 (+) Transcript_6097:2706-3725(+)